MTTTEHTTIEDHPIDWDDVLEAIEDLREQVRAATADTTT